jgi:hypothetical protein
MYKTLRFPFLLIPRRSHHRNRTATPSAANKPNPDRAVSTDAAPIFAVGVALLVLDAAVELVPDDVTVDKVVELPVVVVTDPVVVMELVMLPLDNDDDDDAVPVDMEPEDVEAAVAVDEEPETEAPDVDAEAVVVESTANWPE